MYIDTSVLAAYYCPEPLSRQAEAVLTSQMGPAISWLTVVELISALSRKVREQTLKPAGARKILDAFKTHVDGGYYRLLGIDRSDYEQAEYRIGSFDSSLRTLDALHIAVAVREKLSIVTADSSLAATAQQSGIEVFFVEE